MIFEEYREQFERNLKMMSRTANGVLDTSASVTKEEVLNTEGIGNIRQLSASNSENALRFVFDRRGTKFASAKEFGSFVIAVAELVNSGIIKDGRLFRSGADSSEFYYVRIKDIQHEWEEFCELGYKYITEGELDCARLAYFMEYAINISGHFFADGCGRVAMIMSSWVCMKFSKPLPHYIGKAEYFRSRPPLIVGVKDAFASALADFRSDFYSYFN